MNPCLSFAHRRSNLKSWRSNLLTALLSNRKWDQSHARPKLSLWAKRWKWIERGSFKNRSCTRQWQGKGTHPLPNLSSKKTASGKVTPSSSMQVVRWAQGNTLGASSWCWGLMAITPIRCMLSALRASNYARKSNEYLGDAWMLSLSKQAIRPKRNRPGTWLFTSSEARTSAGNSISLKKKQKEPYFKRNCANNTWIGCIKHSKNTKLCRLRPNKLRAMGK